MNPPYTLTVTCRQTGAELGYISIDSVINDRARGGLRLMPDVTRGELEKLARAMTLKYGLLGLPQGGAKGGVIGDPEASPEERALFLRTFASAAAAALLARRYVPDADMGTTGPDIQDMLEGLKIRLSKREYRGNLSGLYTAGTVFEAARAAARHQHVPLHESRVVIEGFGKVGRPLAGMFADEGARIVAISTSAGGLFHADGLDARTLISRAKSLGRGIVGETDLGMSITAAELKFIDADFFCPCARHDSVLEEHVDRVTARIISPGANCPITPEAQDLLWQRGCICIPDFVANSGGVLGGTMEFCGWNSDEILRFFTAAFRPMVASLIEDAASTGASLRGIAEKRALQRFALTKRQAEKKTTAGMILAAVLVAYHRGLIPSRLMRRLTTSYFRQRLTLSG